jgi:hypothetical protein
VASVVAAEMARLRISTDMPRRPQLAHRSLPVQWGTTSSLRVHRAYKEDKTSTGTPGKKRTNVPVSTIALSTSAIAYLEE